MAKVGPKPKYESWITEDGLTILRGKARDGLTNEEIARSVIGINPATIYEWIKKFPEIGEAIKKGREPIAIKIEDSFYSRCDWVQKEETREELYETEGGKKARKIVRTKRWFPPDTAALIFALKNLRKDKFREKQLDDIEGSATLAEAREILNGVKSVIN